MWIRKILWGLPFCLVGWGWAEENPSWDNVQKEVTKTLILEEKSLLSWQAELREKQDRSREEEMVFLSLSLRAKKTDDALQAMENMSAFSQSPFLDVWGYLYFAKSCRNYRVIRALCERFPLEAAQSGSDLGSTEYFGDVMETWSETRKAQWLHERFLQTEPKEEVKYLFSTTPSSFWGERWLEQLYSMGAWLPTLERFRKEAIASREYEDFIWYLCCVWQFRFQPEFAKGQRDWEWLKELPDWSLATQNSGIASQFWTLEEYELAIPYYRKALKLEITEEEVKTHLTKLVSAMMPAEKLVALYHAGIYQRLAECYQKLDKKTEAQEAMLQNRKICEEFGLPPNAWFAGATQAFTGQRVVEQEILQKEEKNENSPAYWLERADYYRGRKERHLEKEALEKGLALCEPEKMVKTIVREKVPHLDIRNDWTSYRRQFLWYLTKLLFDENQHEVATKLLLDEMQRFPHGETGKSAARIF
ncbi:MAG: hypothetical protein Q4E67_05810, partial [Planctomycetia bacterium]|nr:hypothetical protein [Planctomycetia bacterium]